MRGENALNRNLRTLSKCKVFFFSKWGIIILNSVLCLQSFKVDEHVTKNIYISTHIYKNIAKVALSTAHEKNLSL